MVTKYLPKANLVYKKDDYIDTRACGDESNTWYMEVNDRLRKGHLFSCWPFFEPQTKAELYTIWWSEVAG